MSLIISDLHVHVAGKAVVQGVSLTLKPGEVVAIMGPNASGKTSLALALAGQPSYKVVAGKISLNKQDLLSLTAADRVKAGLFLSWQNPVAVRGVVVEQLLRRAVINCRDRVCKRIGQLECCLRVSRFRNRLKRLAKELKLNPELLFREINVGFSGGEKKKLQLLELFSLKPDYALLDEIDAGLDIDSLKLLAKLKNRRMGILLVTHGSKVFKYLKPDKVLVMRQGRLVARGGQELIKKIEREGYAFE